jgi:hypothetical protein
MRPAMAKTKSLGKKKARACRCADAAGNFLGRKGRNIVRIGQLIGISLLGIGILALPVDHAAADTAGSSGTVLYDSAGFIQGQQSFVQAFDITTAGTLTVSLESIPWLDTITNLQFFLSTATGIVGNEIGPGTESINVAPGMIYAHWFGDADGVYGVGSYGLKLVFQPNGITPVPLPSTWILMLSGLALLGLRSLKCRIDDKRLTIK